MYSSGAELALVRSATVCLSHILRTLAAASPTTTRPTTAPGAAELAVAACEAMAQLRRMAAVMMGGQRMQLLERFLGVFLRSSV